jgi:hypothetical protein
MPSNTGSSLRSTPALVTACPGTRSFNANSAETAADMHAVGAACCMRTMRQG